MATENNDDRANANLFLREKRLRPKAFQMAELPSLYRSSLDLDHFVDPPLHLIALGCMRTTIRCFDSWVSARGRKSEFLKLVRPDLYRIRDLDLDWCELVPKTFGGSYGGHISDNFMALGRLSPWLYSSFLILKEPEPYQEPTTHVDRWTVKDCRSYLTLRGLKVPKYVAQMRLAVQKNKKKPLSKQAKILDVPVCTAPEVFQCVVRMYLLLCELFQDSTTIDRSVPFLHAQIRLFLSSFDRLDLATRKSRKSPPRWLSSYNFMCLLNIPGMVEKFGPYRNLYEGKYCGERYNSVLKPCANRTSHRNRSTNILRNLIREKSMEAVQHNFDKQNASNISTPSQGHQTNKSLIYRKAHRYKNITKARLHYDSNYPLSILIYKEATEEQSPRLYGLCYIWQHQVLVCPITRREGSEFLVGLSVKYWSWRLHLEPDGCRAIESIEVVDYGLLLPLNSDAARLRHNLQQGNYYTISTYRHNSEGTVLFC